jgi:hypothetical protein
LTYTVDVDPQAHDDIAALPDAALVAPAEAFTVLQLVPWSGQPYHRSKPDGAMRTLPFGSSGVITYIVVEDLQRVDVLVITWIG